MSAQFQATLLKVTTGAAPAMITAWVGVMLRESLDPQSRFVSAGHQPRPPPGRSPRVYFARTQENGPILKRRPRPQQQPPHTFTSHHSKDGVNWRQATDGAVPTATIAMNKEILVGFAVASGSTTTLEATFERIR